MLFIQLKPECVLVIENTSIIRVFFNFTNIFTLTSREPDKRMQVKVLLKLCESEEPSQMRTKVSVSYHAGLIL